MFIAVCVCVCVHRLCVMMLFYVPHSRPRGGHVACRCICGYATASACTICELFADSYADSSFTFDVGVPSSVFPLSLSLCLTLTHSLPPSHSFQPHSVALAHILPPSPSASTHISLSSCLSLSLFLPFLPLSLSLF